MLAIRLARFGAKKKPAYRIVVMEKSRARNSKSLEILGHYNPTKDPIILSLNQERIQHWINMGAQPSATVRRLMAVDPKDVVTTEKKPRIEPTPRAKIVPSAKTSSAPAEQSEPASTVPAEEPPDSQAEVKSAEQPQPSTETTAPVEASGGEGSSAKAEEDTPDKNPDLETKPAS